MNRCATVLNFANSLHLKKNIFDNSWSNEGAGTGERGFEEENGGERFGLNNP